MNELHLYGTVGQSFWGEEAFSNADVVAALKDMEGDLTVFLNSGGGIVFEGTAIYNALRAYPGKKRVIIQGIAASMASVIAMAGDEIVMGEGALMMVHDPAQLFTEGRGTEEDHLRMANGLGKAAVSMARIYARRTGLSIDEVRAIMKPETYMDGPEALAKGFATELSEDLDTAQDAAAFDYTMYRHAPPALRAIGRRFQSQISQPALVAMIAGIPAQQRTLTMAKENQTEEDDIDAMDEEEESQDQTSEDTTDDEKSTEDDALDVGADDDDDETPATANQLLRMAASFGRPAATAQHMIAKKMTATGAAAYLAKEVQGTNPMSATNRRGPATAQIHRDERQTMRTGMADAIVAQMGRARDVTGPARKYMGMSLVDMAAQVIKHRGPVRSASDKIRVFEAAAHSTSDFPAIFENALNKRLLQSYTAQQPTFTAVADRLDFQDFRQVPLIRAGDFPNLQKVNEGGEIKHGTFGESRETAILSSYGIQIMITRQMMINDDLGAIDRILGTYGQRVALFEDKTFYEFAMTAKLSDNKNVFHADHGNLAASGTVLSVATLDAGLQAMALQTSLDGDVLGIVPSIILTGAKQALNAKRIIAEVTASTAAEVNPFSGDFMHIQTPRITGTEWYLLTAPGSGGGSQWVYGYLDGAEGPRVRTEEPFGRQGMAISVEHDFGVGAQDSRFGYKNPGAV